MRLQRGRNVLYGFGPYRQFEDNVTKRVLAKLGNPPRLAKIVFPVKFDRRQFLAVLTSYRPQYIIALGQCSRGRLLRIESRALNLRRRNKKEKARPIVRGGTPKLFTNLRPELGRTARRSRNAGDYVCNFSIYVILQALLRRRLSTRYGFIHIPHDYDPARAARLIEKAIKRMVRD